MSGDNRNGSTGSYCHTHGVHVAPYSECGQCRETREVFEESDRITSGRKPPSLWHRFWSGMEARESRRRDGADRGR
jgi:hypothetical protein